MNIFQLGNQFTFNFLRICGKISFTDGKNNLDPQKITNLELQPITNLPNPRCEQEVIQD